MNHTVSKSKFMMHPWESKNKDIIRLDLCNGLRREVAGKAMPFGQVP